MGRYIYITDAYFDYKDDIKRGRYNPLESNEVYTERAKIQIEACISESITAFGLIDIKRYKNILGNIIYLGLEETVKELY